MSQWNSGVPANPPTSQGQVAFYDPTKFQKGASDFPNIPTSSQQNHVDTSNASDASGMYNNQGENPPTSNSWSSWGAWDPNSAAYNNLGQTGQAGQANTDENQPGNEFGGYNQQWYGNQQWNQNGMVWDPNSQQWVQYNYQSNDANYQQGDANYQQGDANYQHGQNNQYPGYNQYWTGDAGVNGQQNNYNGDFQQGGAGDQSAQQGNVYTQNFQGNMPHGSVNEVPVSDESATTGGVVSEDTDEQTDDLDESQSTEPTTETESSDNQSLNRSLGNYEEGVLDGYTRSEELVHENENKANEQVYHGDAVNYGENFSNNGAGMSAMDSQGFDLSGQMQAVSLHDNNQTDHIRSKSGLDHATLPVSSQQQYPNVPFVQPPVTGSEFPYQSQQVPAIDNTDAVSSFSDWEMVPPQPKEVTAPFVPEVSTVVSSEPQTLMAPSHSRNASLDDNVHFFIGSNASSTRVSPSAKTDDAGMTMPSNSAGQDVIASNPNIPNSEAQMVNPGYNTVPVVQEETISQSVVSDSFAPPGPSIDTPPTSLSHPPEQGPPPAGVEAPPSGPQAPPPMMIGVNKGGNPYRKSPFTDSTAENSMLSSTRYDMTQPNYENSPVLLNQSISPIPPEMQKQDKKNDPSPEITSSKPPQSVTDTPVSTGKKPSGIPESPIMPRKESPFQPPGKNKPMKASHNIGVSKKSEDAKENIPSNGNPDKDRSSEERSSDRRSNDRDSSKRYEGRRTPDWDSRRRDNAGRRTPDWDRRRPDRGRRTPEWDSRDDRNRDGSDRDRHRRYEDDDRDRVTSRPPRPNNDNDRGDRGQSSRTRQSAFHQIQNNRGKNNVSPATSLWDAPEGISNVSNILLVPQTSDTQASQPGTSAPSVLTPVASLITSLSEQIKTEDKSDINSKGQNVSDNKHNSSKDTRDSKDKYRDRDADRGRDRDNDDRDVRGNRSYESLRDRDRSFKDSRTNSREKLSMYSSRNSLDDDPRDRSRRGDSRERERSYRDKDYYDRYRDRDRERDRDRPPSRNGSTVDGYGRRDYRDRDRDRDRDSYREREYYSRKYDRDRPRSRQGDRDRPPSRQTEGERPRSRGGEYDKESSYYRDKYRSGYDYDDYYRRNYYDRQYYDYYYGQQYGQGYDYDDYYRRNYYDRQYYDYYYGQQYGQGGYYDEHGYYHTDQRYHYDYHQKRSRTGTPGSLSDGGEEISKIEEKSKKSDKKGEKKRFDYPPDLHDYSHRGHYDSYYGYYDYDQSGYRWDPHISQWVATTATEVEPQRQTPEKFMYPHVRAAFGPNGQLIKVLPNGPADGQPATVEIHDVQALLEENEESEELRGFPGPLVRGDTHKNDVLLFCQQQAQTCTENMELEDRESAELIWRFLELMIKQNGTVVGTDIADLLLKGHEPTTLDYKRTGMKIASSTDNLDLDEEGSEGRISRGTTPIDRSLVNRGKSVDDVTDRFRHLLLYGRKKDAIDWAMKNHLWGHALFLASKMDTRMHANVMTRFANVAMRMNDPLQTLYQLMSGRQPAAVTSVGEEKWGDWRPHLAMILSNHSAKPDLDRKSITQLGDTLASRGFLHASHFCYLMSQTSFGSYNKKSSKIVLVGSSHSLPLELFANNQAIQCTEIYEYALALGNTAVSLANFQYFKYLYCTRLIDYGLAQEALQYCEVISKHINMNPAFYQHVLVKLVYDMSSQLKFADPHIQESGDDDTPDPDWLRELHTTLVQFEEGAIQCISGSVTPAYMGTAASSESGEVGMILQGTDTTAGYHQEMFMNKTDHTQHYQTNVMGDQSQYNAQYGQEQYGYHQGVADMSQYPSNMTSHDPNTDQSHHPEQYQSGVDGNQLQQGTSIYQQQQQQDAGNHVENNGYQPNLETNNYAGEGLQWPSQNSQQTENQQTGHMTGHMGYESTNQTTDVNTTTQHAFTTQTTQSMGHYQPYGTNHHQPNFPPNVNLGESQTSQASTRTHRSSSLASTTEDDEGQDTMDGGYLGQGHNQGIFDLQPAQQKIVAPPLRKRTVSESSNGSTGGVSKPSSMTSRNQTSKTEDKKGIVSQADTKGKQGGGIFAKIGGLFARSKNEMKLPDDKEPSIVWDPVQKRWIDKDADEADLAPAAPPPKDTDLSGPTQAPPVPTVSSTAPSTSMPPPAPPAGGNKYSRRKGLGARGQYVDVMNPKPSSNSQVPTNLFSTLPSVHSAPAIFNPTGNDSSSSVPSTQASEPIQEEKPSTGPDPSSSHSQGGLSAPPTSENLSRTSSRSSLSREIQEILGKNDPSAPIQTSLPTMFNPAQFQNNQLNKAPAAGPGHRLSNRRVYPK